MYESATSPKRRSRTVSRFASLISPRFKLCLLSSSGLKLHTWRETALKGILVHSFQLWLIYLTWLPFNDWPEFSPDKNPDSAPKILQDFDFCYNYPFPRNIFHPC